MSFKETETPTRAVVTGIDGSGKSTAAHAAARLLSMEHPESDIRVADSEGLTQYLAGDVVRRRFERLASLEPGEESGKLMTMLRMGAFTVLRQQMEQQFSHNKHSLTIGVRDPYRVDLATYMPIFLGDRAPKDPRTRLQLLNKLSSAQHPDSIAYLGVDPTAAHGNTQARDTNNIHETPAKLKQAAEEFPVVLDAYQQLNGVPHSTIDALTPHTAEAIAAQFEPLVPRTRKPPF